MNNYFDNRPSVGKGDTEGNNANVNNIPAEELREETSPVVEKTAAEAAPIVGTDAETPAEAEHVISYRDGDAPATSYHMTGDSLVKDDLASAEEEYGDDMSETVYFATLILDEELIAQINAYFDKSVPETDK